MIPRECVEPDAGGREVAERRLRDGSEDVRAGSRARSTPVPADQPDDPGSPDGSDSGLAHPLTTLRQYGDPSHSSGGLSRLVTLAQHASFRSAPAMPEPHEGGVAAADPVRIGKYLVVELLDGGGQAQVFRVMHPELARELALKLGRRPIAAPREAGTSGEAGPLQAALLHEGRLLARCDHPNLVRVFDLGIHEGRPYVVMEYVPGLTLKQFARQHRSGPREAARLIAELAGAVAYLHAQGIVHQDIKPRNVLIDERGRPRLIDFGVARWDHAWSGDGDDWSGGTANYMSPEQAMGQSDRIGPWTDVFGLGALLYHLLTLGPLYRGASETSVVRQAREAGYLPIRDLAPSTPRGLARIVHRALAAEPERRYRNAAEMEAALRRFLARRRIVAVVLAIALATSTLALALAFPRIVRERMSHSRSAERVTGSSTVPAALSTATPPRGQEAAGSPRILSFRVDAFRVEPPENLGSIGVSPRKVRVDDEVEVSAHFDATAFGYLIAMDPEGHVQLCQPLEESEPPSGSEEIRIHQSKAYALTGRPGLQLFVAVASRKPLPPYEKWRGAEGLRRLWKPCDDGHAWRFDGLRFERLSAQDRGELKDRPGSEPPAPLRAVCDYLAQSREFDAVAAIAFPVKPKE
jgi:serine/threonine protein kinase